jgi:DNA polymerase-3 subunit alpha
LRYVSLHTHTTFSYGDGFGLPSDHVARVKDLEMTALAVTEHGNVTSHVKLELAAAEAGIKPIFGLEAYAAPSDMRETGNTRKWHMTVLAMDQVGYQNLMELVSRSWDQDNYRWPTVLGDNLKQHQEGLIVTSGCADSHLASTLLGGKWIPAPESKKERDEYYAAAVKVMLSYKRLLGDRYYLEVQRFPGLARTRELNAQYAKWSKEFGIPLLATADVHYPLPEQNEIQKILHASSRATGTVAAAEAGWEYDILLTYPLSDQEITDDLIRTGLTRREAEAAVIHTEEVAQRCNVSIPKMDRIRYPATEASLAPWDPPAHVAGSKALPKSQWDAPSPPKRSSGTGAARAGSTAGSTSASPRRRRRSTPPA